MCVVGVGEQTQELYASLWCERNNHSRGKWRLRSADIESARDPAAVKDSTDSVRSHLSVEKKTSVLAHCKKTRGGA